MRDKEWEDEIAREEGMLHGIEAYNDVRGMGTSNPEDEPTDDGWRSKYDGEYDEDAPEDTDREDFHSDLGNSYEDREPYFPGE